MNIKLKLAIISSIVAIVVAVIQFGPGWFSSLGTDGVQSPKQEINNRGVSVGGDFNQIQSMVISKDLQNAETIIIQRNWQDAERDPAFRRFVRSRYQKDIEDLNTAEKATFWQDMQKYLDEEKEADKKYAEIKKQNVGDELKSLFSKIDQAKASFDYAEVDRLLQGFEQKHVELISDLAKAFYLRAQNLQLQIKYQDAERYYKKAVALDEQNPLYLDAYAMILLDLGGYAKAESYERRALDIYEKQLGAEHPSVATSLNNLAGLLDAQGKYGEAEPLYRRALLIREEQLGGEHPDVAASLNNLAGLFRAQGKYGEAEPLYRRALGIDEKALGLVHPEVATDLNNLAGLLRMRRESTEKPSRCTAARC